ncbi:MAG: Fe-S cluster assembly ATPase SufC [Alphaproteobacteria bacterium]|nr:Fe-S cluster assembly ATPase SufC [Alphaproteobacteria bacterium]
MAKVEIKNLHVSVEDKDIIKGLNLTINDGEVHAIMGPNGTGKSTLSYVISGRPGYTVKEGSIKMNGKDIFAMDIEERAREGVFLAFQYPVEIPGVATGEFLKHATNAIRKHRGEEILNTVDFRKLVRKHTRALGIKDDMIKRSVNVGFSGGEKKRVEMLQMAVLDPSFAILDETDSGLDIDALKVVSDSVNTMRNEKRSMMVITHYQRLLQYIVPDFVHVFAGGKIVKSGGKELALELERNGYAEWNGESVED